MNLENRYTEYSVIATKTLFKALGNALLWHCIVSAFCLPFSYAFGGWNTLRNSFAWLTFGFWSQVIVGQWASYNKKLPLPHELNQDIIRGLAFAAINNIGVTGKYDIGSFPMFMAIGITFGGLTGRYRKSPFLETSFLIALLILIIVLVFVAVIMHKPQQLPHIIITTIALPASYAVGQTVGILLSKCIKPMLSVWHELKALGFVLGGYALGYLFIAIVFIGFYEALMRFDPKAIKGLPTPATHIDYWFYSFMVLTTLGTDATPQTPAGKVLVSIEALLGIAWTVVVFAAVLTAAQRFKAGDQVTTKPE